MTERTAESPDWIEGRLENVLTDINALEAKGRTSPYLRGVKGNVQGSLVYRAAHKTALAITELTFLISAGMTACSEVKATESPAATQFRISQGPTETATESTIATATETAIPTPTEIVVESTYKKVEVYGEPVVHNVELGGEKVDISLVMDKSYAESPSHPVEKIDLVGNGPTHLAKGMLEMLWGMDKSKEGMDLWETLKAVQAGEESPEALTVTIQIEDPALSGVQAVDKKLKLFPDLDPNAETDPVGSLRVVVVNAEIWIKDVGIDSMTITSKAKDGPNLMYFGTTLRYDSETGTIDLLVSPLRKFGTFDRPKDLATFINYARGFLVDYGVKTTYPWSSLATNPAGWDINNALINSSELNVTKGK